MRRERLKVKKTQEVSGDKSANLLVEEDSCQPRSNLLLIGDGCREHRHPADPFVDAQQNRIHGLHSGGKEFSLLRSSHSHCERAGWTAVL